MELQARYSNRDGSSWDNWGDAYIPEDIEAAKVFLGGYVPAAKVTVTFNDGSKTQYRVKK